jgi:hypothetical protein
MRFIFELAIGTTTYFHGCVTPIVVSPEQKQVINWLFGNCYANN